MTSFHSTRLQFTRFQMSDAPDGVHLSLLKDHDNPNVAKLTLDLDPSTMLLVKK